MAVEQLPEWAARQREQEKEWIAENLHLLWPAATSAYAELGRGVLVIDTTVCVENRGHPISYFPQAVLAEIDVEDAQRMVGEYAPEKELVVFFLKAGGLTSVYRMRPLPAGLSKLQ